MSLKLRLARGSNKLPKAHQRISFISIFMCLDLNGKGESPLNIETIEFR